MVKTVIQTLQRLLALLAVTGALSQGAEAPTPAELPLPDPSATVQEAQFPHYAALLPEVSRFENDSYIGVTIWPASRTSGPHHVRYRRPLR